MLIFGKTGSGKTTLAKRIIPLWKRVLVFDPLSEYDGGLVLTDFSQIVEYFSDEREDFFTVLRLRGSSISETERMYNAAAEAAFEIGDLLLVLEEAEMFLTSHDQDTAVNYLISFGRHKGISLLGIGRRPFELAVNLRAQFTSIFTFRQTEPRDIMYCEALGFSGSEISELGEFQFATVGEQIDAVTQTQDRTLREQVALPVPMWRQDIPLPPDESNESEVPLVRDAVVRNAGSDHA